MSYSRDQVDLDLVLDDPNCARAWVEAYDWGTTEPPKYVVWGVDQKIHLSEMTNEEAVLAAHIILHDVEKKRAMREKSLERYEH